MRTLSRTEKSHPVFHVLFIFFRHKFSLHTATPVSRIKNYDARHGFSSVATLAGRPGECDPMSPKQSEAIVLRTYPLREADLLVTLFTRAEGKIRGVARSAKRSKRRFGGALEPLTWVRAYYEDREGQELARLDSCDILESPLSTTVDYARAVALEHVAEILDE